MLNLYFSVLVNTLAVWYKTGKFGGEFWLVRDMESSAERKLEPGLVESLMKTLLKKEALVCDPQLRRKLSEGVNEAEKGMKRRSIKINGVSF